MIKLHKNLLKINFFHITRNNCSNRQKKRKQVRMIVSNKNVLELKKKNHLMKLNCFMNEKKNKTIMLMNNFFCCAHHRRSQFTFFNEDFWLMCHIEWTLRTNSMRSQPLPKRAMMSIKKSALVKKNIPLLLEKFFILWIYVYISRHLRTFTMGMICYFNISSLRLLYNLILFVRSFFYLYIVLCAVPYYNMFVPLPWT